jgi:hypothetical protein
VVILTVGTLTPTAITLTTNTTNPAPNQPFTLSGTLTANNTPLPGKLITFLSEDPSGNWSRLATTTTDANGTYTFTHSESSQGNYDYQALFAGDTTYGSSFASVRIGVGNLQKSVTSLLATNNTPAVNQTFTLYGFLQDGVSGAPLAGQPIILQITSPSGQNVSVGTTTDANGTYTFTRSESTQGTYVYQVEFWGNSSYLASPPSMLEMNIGNPIPTTLSLNITNNNPDVNQSFTISGYLTDINGTKLSGRALTVWTRLPTGQMAPRGEPATDSNGYYSVTISEQNSGQYRYEVDFPGDGTYGQSANWVLVAIGTLQPTKISANTNVTNPGVSESYTLSGNLTDANGTPLSGKEVDLYQSVTGQLTQRESILQTRYTDQNGHYFFILNESTSSNYTYTARFCGDQIYAYSQATVRLTVGTLTPTTITLTTNNTTPAVNQSFTLSGTLTAGTTPLSGKPITLGRTDPSGNWNAANTTTTSTNGTYTFTCSESAQGVYTYQAEFLGDTYAPANATVRLTVGTLTPTTITLTTNNTTPAVNQSFTLSGTLTAGTTPLSGKPITLGRTDPSGNWNAANTTTTSTNGTYTFTCSESAQGVYTYQAEFLGDTYAPANATVRLTVSLTVGTLTPTTITLTTNNTTPAVNQSFTLSGTLTAGTTPLSGENVTIYHLLNGIRYNDTTNTTNATGQIALTTSGASTGTRTYSATFTGDTSYQNSTSSAVTITVINITKMGTALTIAAPASALTKQNFTVNGTLSASAVGVGSANITLQRSTNNAAWTNATTTATDVNGNYQFSYNESAAGTYYYRAAYSGNATYGSVTSNTVSVNITKASTALTLTASNTTPAVNQSVTFTATLRSGGTPIPKLITVYYILNGVRYNYATAYTTLTFATKWTTPGVRTYYASFAGDSSYNASASSGVPISVGATQLTLTASNTTPAVNQSVTFTATLRSGGTPIPKLITVYYILNGVRYNYATAYTTLTFATKWTTPGVRTYYASFAGDSSSQASTSAVVTITVH